MEPWIIETSHKCYQHLKLRLWPFCVKRNYRKYCSSMEKKNEKWAENEWYRLYFYPQVFAYYYLHSRLIKKNWARLTGTQKLKWKYCVVQFILMKFKLHRIEISFWVFFEESQKLKFEYMSAAILILEAHK